jgi:hypothetical protein
VRACRRIGVTRAVLARWPRPAVAGPRHGWRASRAPYPAGY